MTIIAIFVALLLERLMGGAHYLHKFDWFESWRRLVESHLAKSAAAGVAYVLVVGPLLLGLGALILLSQRVMWGAGELFINILVLATCLGPRLLDKDVDCYLAARETNDREALAPAVFNLTGQPVPDKLSAEVRDVTEAVFYQANMRWYAVLFWFLLLGPIGALLYRLTVLLKADEQAAGIYARRVYGAMGWLPARITGFFFGLVGNLDEALYAFKTVHRAEHDWVEGNRMVLSHTGCAAIRLEMDMDNHQGESLSWSAASDWVRRARGVVLRALILWLAAVAVFTLLGWMV